MWQAIHSDVGVSGASCKQDTSRVEGQAGDGSNAGSHEPLVVLNSVDTGATGMVDANDLLHWPPVEDNKAH